MKIKCTHCQAEFVGRSDKKFCTATCKTNFFRVKNKNTTQHDAVKKIDGILHRNHQILSVLLAAAKSQKQMMPRLVLDNAGFNFDYFTGSYQNKEGKMYHYIYDFAWMIFSSQEVLLVQKRKI